MGIEGGELDRLYGQLRDAQERRAEMERQRDQALQDLRAQRQRNDEAVLASARLEEQLNGARRDLSDSRRVSERVPLLEQTLESERKRVKDLQALLHNTQGDLEEARATVKSQDEELGNLRTTTTDALKSVKASALAVEGAKELVSALSKLSGVS